MEFIRYFLIALLMIIFAHSIGKAEEYRKKIVVIDTGVNYNLVNRTFLCSSPGVATFGNKSDLSDLHGHGTNVVQLISQGMDATRYCIYMIKGMNTKIPETEALPFYFKALQLLPKIENISIVNLSLGGFANEPTETMILNDLLNKGARVVAASGNDGNKFMNIKCSYFPVCALYTKKLFYSVSSYDILANDGANMGFQYRPFCGGKPKMCGTSQATAYFTGELAR